MNKNLKKLMLKRLTKKACVLFTSRIPICKVLLSCAIPKDKDGRFRTIKEIGRLRMAQPSNSAYRMESICVGLPTVLEHHHGYHCDCYQRFTANLK